MLIAVLAAAIVAWLSSQLAKQKKTEFKPRNDELSFVNTEPCDACCAMLAKVRDAAKKHLSGKNLESFLTEVGISFNTYVILCFRMTRRLTMANIGYCSNIYGSLQ